MKKLMKIISTVIGLFKFYCPDCGGEMEDCGQHFHGLSTSTLYKCKKCWMVWI